MIDHRLRNWQRWALDDSPHIGYPSKAAVFGTHIHEDSDREGWGASVRDAIEAPIDSKDARLLDDHIIRLPRDYLKAIRTVLVVQYRREISDAALEVARRDLPAAKRCLKDKVYGITNSRHAAVTADREL